MTRLIAEGDGYKTEIYLIGYKQKVEGRGNYLARI